MTYTHLAINELVLIEADYQEDRKVTDIVTSLGRSKQTIYKGVIQIGFPATQEHSIA